MFKQNFEGGKEGNHSEILGKNILGSKYYEGTASTKALWLQGTTRRTTGLEENRREM